MHLTKCESGWGGVSRSRICDLSHAAARPDARGNVLRCYDRGVPPRVVRVDLDTLRTVCKAAAAQCGPLALQPVSLALIQTCANESVAAEILETLQSDGSVEGGTDSEGKPLRTRPRFRACSRCARVPEGGLQ